MAVHRNSEFRRLVHFKVCYYLYEMQLCLDFWTIINLQPNIQTVCEVMVRRNEPSIYLPIKNISWNMGMGSSELKNGVELCSLHFYMDQIITVYANFHVYYLFHLWCLRRYWHKRRSERVENERKRVQKIWEEILQNRKESSTEDFSQKNNQDSTAPLQEKKSYIKLPKHYQPSMLMRMQ
jgi:hypothetical protein